MKKEAVIVIKSTIPVGLTESLREEYRNNNIIFTRVLREGNSLQDTLSPANQAKNIKIILQTFK